MCCRSSFHGKIAEIPGISVDNFENENLYSRAYFLSHYHGDHIQGLSHYSLKKHLAKGNIYIYTSEITASIIEFEECSSLMSYVRPLGRDSELITLPSVPEMGWDELILEVTLIPAGHSFGSTMFLFKTAKTTVLYTGDFRIRINDIPKYTKLHDVDGEPIAIDAMYVDTTFIGVDYEVLAKRSDTADSVIDEIGKWLMVDEGHAVSLYMYAMYTFEFMVNRIYSRLKTRVYIDDCRWGLYSKFRNQVPGMTNDLAETRIHLCQHRYGNSDHSRCIDRNHGSYLHVYLTAMIWRHYDPDKAPVVRTSDKLIKGCFSTHCSRSEIISFVEHFRPSKVVGFPAPYDDGSATSGGDDHHSLSPKIKMPAAVKKRYETARCNNVVKRIF